MNLNKLATTTILLLMLALSTSAASAASVSIEDTNASVGATTTAQIMAYGVTNLSQFGILLSYNPSVVTALSAENNPNLPDDFSGESLHDFSHASEGYVLLGSNPSTATPVSGDVLLTTVTLQAEGGDNCELGLTIKTLKDSDSAAITLDSVINGTFTVDTSGQLTLTWQAEPPASVTQGDNVTFDVEFSESADYYFRIENSTGDAVWRYPASGTGTAKNPDSRTWTTTTDTPQDDYTIIINIDGVDNSDTRTVTVEPATLPSMDVAADPTSVTENTATDVTFTVTSDGSPVDGALVTLSGCGVDTNGTTIADGTVAISVTATSTGTIGVTVTKDGYDDATTTVNVTDGVTTNPMAVTADPTSVINNTATDVTFTVTSDGSPVDGALVTLSGCGVDTNGTTIADGTVAISVTATSTGTIGVTVTKDGYDDATTTVNVTDGVTTNPMAVTADPTSVTENTATDVTFTVTSDGSPVDGALVTLSGCGVDTNGTTIADGTVAISVTATSTGTIGVTVTKDGYDDATTTVNVTDGVTTNPMAVTADPTSVTENTATDVTFTVTSDGSPVDGALVTLSGCGVDTNGTTIADGTVAISVTATSTGTIGVTVTKDGYDDATTTVNVTDGVTTNPMAVTADPTSVINNTATDVTFTVTSDGSPVDGALVTLSGCGVDTNGTTIADGTVAISVTATSTGTIGVTVTKDGYDDATTTVNVTDGVTTNPMAVTADPTSVINNTATDVTFTVTSDGSPVDGALVTLSGCGVDTNGTTIADGTVAISVTATSTGTIGVTVTKDGYDDATTTVNVTDGVTTNPMAVTADPTSVINNTATDVTFTVTSDGSPVDGALVTLSGCGVDTNGTTIADGTVAISVTATSTGTIGVTVTKDGYDDATTTVNVTDGVTTNPMAVTADPTSVINNTATDVTFTVTSDGSPVDGALVTLSGCGVDTNGTTIADGTVSISVTATSTGAIDVTATKEGYDDATTSVDVNPASVGTYVSIEDTNASVGATTTAQIMAYGVTNLSQFGILLSYNPSVVTALSAENNPNLPDDFSGESLHDFSHASEGYVLLGSNPSTATPVSGDVLLTTVTLQAEGGDNCELGLTIKTLKDSDSAAITLDSVINGTFTVDTSGQLTLTWQAEPPASVTQGDNVTFDVEFSESADYYFRIENSTGDAVWRYPASGTGTAKNPDSRTWTTTTDTPQDDYTIIINIDGVDNSDTRTVTVEPATLPSMDVAADPTSVTENTATDVTFTVTSDGSPVDGALVTLSGCGVDTNGTTIADGTVAISVTATSTGTIGVTVTKDGYDDATTTVNVTDGVTTNPMAVTADPTSVINNTATDVNFTVTSDGTSVEGALVTLSGCGVDVNDTTDENGTVTISVTATSTGAIDVTATKEGYDDATTTVNVTDGVTTNPMAVTADPTSVVNNTATDVTFTVTSDGTPVEDALVTLSGCGVDVNDTTVSPDGTVSISVTATSTGTIGVTVTKDGYDDATTTVNVTDGVTTNPMAVTADPTSVINNTATDVNFTVASNGTSVEGALVTLSGCGVDVNGTTDENGTVTISVTATSTGTINVTATKDGYDDAITTVTVTLIPMDVTAVPTSVLKDTTTDVTFNVTREEIAVDNATVTLLGCGVDTNGTTDENGTVTISVTATSTGTINVTATKDEYENATAIIEVKPVDTGGSGGSSGGSGTYPPGWGQPAPTSTATPAPTTAAPEPTVAPTDGASTEAPTDEAPTESTTEAPTETSTTKLPTKGTPGFGATLTVFVIAGLLVATYLVMRRRE